MNFIYPTYVSLQGIELTEEGRKPVSEERDERSIVVTLASGKNKKYIQGVYRTFTIEWEMVPKTTARTIDGKGGRDQIRSIAQSGGTMTLVLKENNTTTETYTVFLESYTETHVFRRGEGSRYNISIQLEEQGGG